MGQDWQVAFGEKSYDVHAVAGESGTDVTVDGEHLVIETDWRPGDARFRGQAGGRKIEMLIARSAEGYRLTFDGATLDYAVRSPRGAELAALMPIKEAPDMSKMLVCPMPGALIQLHVEEGEEVKAGQPLAVIEAMKMENTLRAEADGVIAKINNKPGDSLAVDEIILELE